MTTTSAPHHPSCLASAEACAAENLRDSTGTAPTRREIDTEALRYLEDGSVECMCADFR